MYVHACPKFRKFWADNTILNTNAPTCPVCDSLHAIVNYGEISRQAAIRLGLVPTAPISEARAVVMVTASIEELADELDGRLNSPGFPPEEMVD